MSDERAAIGPTLSLAAALRHDQLCDEFEARWRQGPPPRIEEMLARVAPEERSSLFTALLKLEIELRSPQSAAAEDYRVRFPQFVQLVDAVLCEPDIETANVDGPRAAEMAPPVLPNYQIIDLLGAGGMGAVYRARHLDLDRLVAVKIIKAGPWSRPEELKRFQREARAVAGLNHPNVVQMYGFGHVDGMPYFVMEYVETG